MKTLCSSTFHLTIVSYEAHAIKYVWKNDEDTLRKSPSLTTLNAYLTKNSTDNCEEKGNWRGEDWNTFFISSLNLKNGRWQVHLNFFFHRLYKGNYSCLKVELTFTRDRAFYFTTVFIPGEEYTSFSEGWKCGGNFSFLNFILHLLFWHPTMQESYSLLHLLSHFGWNGTLCLRGLSEQFSGSSIFRVIFQFFFFFSHHGKSSSELWLVSRNCAENWRHWGHCRNVMNEWKIEHIS